MDVAEVGFAAMARRMIEWDKSLALLEPPMLQIAPDLIVPAVVAVLGDEAAVDADAVCRCLGGALASPATMASTIARNGPNTGAVLGSASVYGLGSGFSSALRIVSRPTPSCLAICRTLRPSR